jgi:hypothetical protein
MFMITDLPAGSYLLRYRRCLTPTGQIVKSRAAMLMPGARMASVPSSRGYVTSGHVTTLGRVAVSRPVSGWIAGMPARPKVTQLTAAQSRDHFRKQGFGGIAGTVLGPHGRHIKGLCFGIYYRGAIFGGPIGADGRYNTGKYLPPGKVAVGFNAVCGSLFGTAAANWAPEWYHGKFSLSAANTVVIKAGKTARGIGGIMRRGGVISGRVTGHTGRGLGGVCVVAVTHKGYFVQQVTTPRDGRYRFQGFDPGRYAIGFFPNCGRESVYLPQWWPGKASETSAGAIRTGFGTARTHVDARMVVGGTISGVVKFRNRHGRPVKGICVDALLPTRIFGSDYFAASNAKGEYAIRGLPAGRYSVYFSTGCNNNGNYLSQQYPHNVTVHVARVTGHINAYLQPGAIVKGTVTDKSTGARLAGICAFTADGLSAGRTAANGTYSMDQIRAGKIQVQFFNCSDHGNYAPQFYRDAQNAATAASIKVRPGQVVSGIDAALAPGATVSGTITLASGHTLTNVCVDAVPVSFSAALDGGSAQSNRGRYAIKNLAPGLYQVFYSSCGGPNIADSWFMQPGKVTDDQSRAGQIFVPAEGSVAGIDAALPLGGFISGWAYGPPGQQGSDVCIEISNARTGLFGYFNGFFDVPVGGGYTIFGFVPGRYLVEFSPCSGANLAFQWYKRAPRPAKATPVLVRPGHTTSNVDAWLTTGGTITGRVMSKATGKPLGGVCVLASSVNQLFYGFGRTNGSGKYVVTGLNSSTYRLDLMSCGKSSLAPIVTGKLRATQGETVTAPAAAMHTYQAGAITGHVAVAGSPRNAATGACVDAIPVDSGLVGSLDGRFGTARRGGYYRISGLVPGRYKVFIGDPFCDTDPGGLVPRWYPNTSRKSKAAVVSVAAGRVTHRISVTLQRDGSLSGTVTDPKPAGKPLSGICVLVKPVARGLTPYLAESTAPDGRYRLGPLPPGRYLVEFEARCGTTGYATQWWRGAGSMSHATPVVIRAGQSLSGIDASMTPTG